ncbi:uncharacterized protein H6S33_011266 [Morchella sextelata]|uniref:uncharacterized protein n=1 Tax=Morchella sextelata TaxID=1174677 RepID=UPI001D03ABC4|nr:uncharacterized protein H6S33_011266 [Morchella sextelata]KAH0610839.1 hypothetical protein H6S33_011266 [Morchella sextelata]
MPPKPQTQKSITSFFSPPGIKGEQQRLPPCFASPRRTPYSDPTPTPLLFTEADMSVDSDEAPAPAPFDTTPSPRWSGGEDGWERFIPPLEEAVMTEKKSLIVVLKIPAITEKKSLKVVLKLPAAAAAAAGKRKLSEVHPSPAPFDATPPPGRNGDGDGEDEWVRFTPPPEEAGVTEKKSLKVVLKIPAAAAGKRKFSEVHPSSPSSSPTRKGADGRGNGGNGANKKRLSFFAAVPSVYGSAAAKAAVPVAVPGPGPVVYAGAACVAARFRAVKAVRSVPGTPVAVVVPVAVAGETVVGAGNGNGNGGCGGNRMNGPAEEKQKEKQPEPAPVPVPEQKQKQKQKKKAEVCTSPPAAPPNAANMNDNLPSPPPPATPAAANITLSETSHSDPDPMDIDTPDNTHAHAHAHTPPTHILFTPHPPTATIRTPFTHPPPPAIYTPPPPPTLSNSPYSTTAHTCQSTPIARQTFGLPYSERAAIAAAAAATTTTAITDPTAAAAVGYLLPAYSPTYGLSLSRSPAEALRAALTKGANAPRGAGAVGAGVVAPGEERRPAAADKTVLVLETETVHEGNSPVDVTRGADGGLVGAAVRQDELPATDAVQEVDIAVPDAVQEDDFTINAMIEDDVPVNADTVQEDECLVGADAMCEDELPVNASVQVNYAEQVNSLEVVNSSNMVISSEHINASEYVTSSETINPPATTQSPPPTSPDALYAHDDFPPDDPFPTPTPKTLRTTISGQPVCTLHHCATCDAESCVHEFFTKYCPLEDVAVGGADLVYPDYVPAPPRRTQAVGADGAQEVLHAPVGRKELLAVLIAAGGLAGYRRLPYLTAEAREFLRWHAERVLGELRKVDGDLLHVQFTVPEIRKLIPAVREYALQNKIRLPNFSANPTPPPDQLVRDLYSLLTYTFSNDNDTKALINLFLTTTNFTLPGRQPGDIQRFIWDAYNTVPDLRDPAIMVAATRLPPFRSPTNTKNNSMRALRRELGTTDLDPLRDMQARHNWAMARLRPVWAFNGGSSDIHDAQWTPDGARFAMSTPCTSDQYNRPGNLMLGFNSAGGPPPLPRVRMLYRHALRVRPTAGGFFERYEYTSVPSIRFSNDGGMLHSCGLDGCVKTWSAGDGRWLGEVGFDDQVVVMETSAAVDGLVAAGRSKGAVSVIQINGSGTHDSVRNLNLFDKANKNKVYPAAMAWGGAGFENFLVVGYDNEGNSKSGGLAVWDVEREVNLFKYWGHIKHPQRHFDVRMGQRGRFVTGSLRPGRIGGSIVRLWDLNTMSEVVECISDQADLNCVTISPCERYLTSSGTTNNTLLWDIRNPSTPLHSLQHGATTMPTSAQTNLAEDDTGVTFITWSPHNSTLFTGGSDGKIKQWDPTRAAPFLVDVAAVESQIMTAAFSPSWDALLVGEASGRATLFSTEGEEGGPVPEIVTDWSEDRALMNPDNDENMRWSSWNGRRAGVPAAAAAAAVDGGEEEEESGVLLGREMVAGGLIVRDPENPRYVWATERYGVMREKERRRKEKEGRGGRA